MNQFQFERRSVAHQVADELQKRYINDNRRKLPSVRELAKQFDVSPNTANDALKLLARLQLIRVVPRQGSFIVSGATLCC